MVIHRTTKKSQPRLGAGSCYQAWKPGLGCPNKSTQTGDWRSSGSSDLSDGDRDRHDRVELHEFER